MSEKLLTQEETLSLLNARAKEAGDSFFVRIFRKQHMGGLPESVATFDEAQLEHLTSPERWLPQLAGGGPIFMFQVYHSGERGSMIGGVLHFSVPTASLAPKSAGEIDQRIVKRAGWAGPPKLLYPLPDAGKAENPLFSIPSNLPPASPPGNSAANNVPGGGSPGAVQFRDPMFERNAALLEQLEQEKAKLARAREEFADEQRRQREELAEQRRRAELESVKRESDQRLKEMEARMLAAVETIRSAAAPKQDVTHTIASITTALTPIIVKMFEGQNEMRLAILKQQDAIAAQAAESNRTLMSAMMTKPSIDPVVERLFNDLKNTMEKNAGQQVPQSTMLHSMADAMASMTQTTMDLVQTAADLNLGGGKPEDHPALKAIREGVKAVSSLFAGYQAALPKGTPGAVPQPHQLPPRSPQPQYAPQPQYLPQPQPPRPVAPPPQAASPQQHQLAEAPLVQLPQAQDVVELMENMFRAKVPVADLVQTFLLAFKNDDPALAQALQEVDGEIEELFSRRLGAFVMANPGHMPYMNELLEAVNREGEAAGIFEPEGPEESDYEDEDDDDDGESQDAA